MHRLLLAAVLLGPGVAAAGAAPPDALRHCMTANLPRAVRVQSVEMTTWDRSGQERVIRGRMFGARDRERTRVMARVEFPGDLAGTAFLLREAQPATEMYVYLPATNRVKRIAGAAGGGKLWGSDFSYNEFRRVANAFADGAFQVVGRTDLDGRAVHEVMLAPSAGAGEAYDAIRVLVDQQTCVPLQAEFRQAGTARKVMTAPATGLRQAGAQWYAAELTLRDLAAGTQTRLRVLGVAPVAKLSPSYFHPQQFHSTR
jgi:hypothetical protein